jgi:hypothetical protein
MNDKKKSYLKKIYVYNIKRMTKILTEENDIKCRMCLDVKPFSEFHKDKRHSSGIKQSCKICLRKKSRDHYVKMKDSVNKRCKAHYHKNKDEKNEKSKAYYHRIVKPKNLKIKELLAQLVLQYPDDDMLQECIQHTIKRKHEIEEILQTYKLD